MPRIVLTVLLAFGLVLAPSTASWATGSLTASAIELRDDVSGLVREYETAYGPRVSSSERAVLRGMTREANRDMNTLVRLVRTAESKNRASDWRRASAHYEAIRTKGDARLDESRDIISSQMSFSEQLAAWSKSRSVMKDLDSLGKQLERRAR